VKISVITVAFNSASTIEDSLRSVAEQSHPDVEHIVIDGASTDNTVAVVRRHGEHLARVVSERDHGIYDAMNKGAALATGDVIGFLNSDDWYAGPDVLSWVNDQFDLGADLVYGDLAFVSSDRPFQVRRVWRDRQHAAQDLFQRGWQPAHPTTFIRSELFRALGGFNTRWRIAADYVFLAAAMRHPGLRLAHVGRHLVNMRLGGASTEGAGAIWRANRECAAALHELGISSPWRTITWKLASKIPQIVRARLGSDDMIQSPPWRPWDDAQSLPNKSLV
jgi:glycosyltransferase